MKRLFALVSVIMLAGTLAACSTESTENIEGTYLTVDINPSVEFIVGEDGEIDSYTALNEDGEIVIADLELEGMNYEAALDLYLEEATELGYIDVNADDNAVYIATSEEETIEDENTDAETVTGDAFDFDEDSLKERVKEKVNEHFKSRGILGAALDKDLHEEYGPIAEEYDLGLGKARLISRAVELDGELTMEEAVEMNMGDIMAILRADHQERMEEFRQGKKEQAQAFNSAMKDEVREKVQTHRDEVEEARENGEEAPFNFDEIKERIGNRSESEESSHRANMEDIKDKARGKMRGNSPFFSDDEETDNTENSDGTQ